MPCIIDISKKYCQYYCLLKRGNYFFRVKFNRVVVKCLDCKATAHLEHKDKIPLPCIPVKSTPSKNGVSFIKI